MVTAIDVKDGAGTTRNVNTLPPLGRTTKSASLPVTIASDQDAISVTLSNVNANGQATMANSAPVAIASDQSGIPVTNTGTFATQALLKPSATANGTTSSRINAAASTNATSVKASAGQVYSVDVFNVAAYDVFLKFYNKASAPTVGTDTPIWTIPLKAGTGYSTRFPLGKAFSTGIAYAITKLQADSDTTAVAALDVTGTMDWI